MSRFSERGTSDLDLPIGSFASFLLASGSRTLVYYGEHCTVTLGLYGLHDIDSVSNSEAKYKM